MHWGANVGGQEGAKPNHRSFAPDLFYILGSCVKFSLRIFWKTHMDKYLKH